MRSIYYFKNEINKLELLNEIQKFHFLDAIQYSNIRELEKIKNQYIYLSEDLPELSAEFIAKLKKQDNVILMSIEEVKKLPYQRMVIEISGKCNALCKYCPTGVHNRKYGISSHNAYMSPKDFIELINSLVSKKVITNNTVIDLYNWGEPLLNPNFGEIASFLSQHHWEFTISTNASIIPQNIKNSALSGLTQLVISMPGFSEYSYKHIYGFDFSKIKENIKTLVALLRQSGFKGQILFLFHVYQYNMSEIYPAKLFAENLGAKLYPCFAFPISIDMCIDYLRKTLDKDLLYDMSKELFMFHIDKILNERPEDYCCGQAKLLTIDENRNLILGCCVDKNSKYGFKNYSYNKIEAMNLVEIRNYKRQIFTSEICKLCRDTHADYCGSNCGKDSFIFMEGLKI